MGCDIWGKWVYIYEPLLEEEGERRVEPALGGRPALARGVGTAHRARAPLELRAELRQLGIERGDMRAHGRKLLVCGGERGLDAGGVTRDLYACVAAAGVDRRLLEQIDDGTLFPVSAPSSPSAAPPP